jgi:hypothetical protein
MKLLVLVACKCNTHVKHGEMKTDGAKCAWGSFELLSNLSPFQGLHNKIEL